MMKTKWEDTAGLCCGWKFALRNKASTGTAVEVSSSSVYLCTVTPPCYKSRHPPASRTGPHTPNEMVCGSEGCWRSENQLQILGGGEERGQQLCWIKHIHTDMSSSHHGKRLIEIFLSTWHLRREKYLLHPFQHRNAIRKTGIRCSWCQKHHTEV